MPQGTAKRAEHKLKAIIRAFRPRRRMVAKPKMTASLPTELLFWNRVHELTKYWLSALPADIGFRRLADMANLRGRIERDYQELKQEVGLGHFGWRAASAISQRSASQPTDS